MNSKYKETSGGRTGSLRHPLLKHHAGSWQLTTNSLLSAAAVAWLAASVFYFYQYSLRSAPSVMMPQLGDTFGLTAAALAGLVGLFYYGYAPFSLVAGVAMDQFGPRKIVPAAAALVGIGALLFASGDPSLARIGRFLQGAGGVFALISAVYIATNYFPANRGATLVGATQMFGMAGGSAGQFLVGGAITGGLIWSQFWFGAGVAGFVIAGLLFAFIPASQARPQQNQDRGKQVIAALGAVFRNPQSILCGLIAGLLFLPTTVFGMVWGVRFLQESHNVPYGLAVMRSAAVPFGWIIGCPLLGLLSDRTRPPPARHHRQRRGSAGVPDFHSLWPARPVSALQPGADRRHRLRRGDASLHGHQGSQPARA